ncbi:MAG: hypothetical protein IKU62_09115 [Ruminiclostridium sp.]|nr:hypothetical protein [Ruminiclostridium sp.]
MRGKLTRRQIDRLENIAITLLACTAIFLVSQTNLFQTFVGQGTGSYSEAYRAVAVTELPDESPVAVMVQNDLGRCGLRYDTAGVDEVYSQGLKDLLYHALDKMEKPKRSSQEDWQQVITQSETWVCYDYLYNIPFTSATGQEGWARLFLISFRNGQAEALYGFDQNTGEYWVSQVGAAGLALPARARALEPNQVRFAFEDPALTDLLPGYMMADTTAPSCQAYSSSNPLMWMDETGIRTMLETVGFNLQAVSIYESADGTVVREGSDTIRIQQDGSVIYHGSESGEARYEAGSLAELDLREEAERILELLTADRTGQARFLCQGCEEEADGTTVLTYSYLLEGARVSLGEYGWAAQFRFQGEALISFEIIFRQYDSTETPCAVPPERQAAAAAEAQGQTGKELQLCHRDDGSGLTRALWTVREIG